MISTVTDCPPKVELDLFLNVLGELTLDLLKTERDQEPFDSVEFSLVDMTKEFIYYSRNGETGLIENPEAESCYTLINQLKRCVRLLEEAVYEDNFPDD